MGGCAPRGPNSPQGGRSGAGLTIRNVSQKGPKQQAILHMIGALLDCLPEDTQCVACLSGKGIDPIETLTSIATLGL